MKSRPHSDTAPRTVDDYLRQLRAALEGFAPPAAALVREIDPAAVRQLLVDYWIAAHKNLKAFSRGFDLSAFAGLYGERMPAAARVVSGGDRQRPGIAHFITHPRIGNLTAGVGDIGRGRIDPDDFFGRPIVEDRLDEGAGATADIQNP